ncbi:nitroreductase/quinone reductase family protein [Cellulomonas sp. 179-A 4D5 NHS]|uniref:nitroreductase/quinone reductase family protein n=1 Tax=Cellulomonas sp. 179-A 4D5 NHS TaxID=3142378 RepID=UPI0039A38ECF
MDLSETNRRVVEQFRAGGPVEGMHRERLLLLTTTGARSGRAHTTPMMFHREDDRLLVVASAMGAPTHPDWYTNLVAEPRVHVEVGDEEYDAVATPLAGTDREEVWSRLVALYPFFGEHAAATTRTIPVVELTRT